MTLYVYTLYALLTFACSSTSSGDDSPSEKHHGHDRGSSTALIFRLGSGAHGFDPDQQFIHQAPVHTGRDHPDGVTGFKHHPIQETLLMMIFMMLFVMYMYPGGYQGGGQRPRHRDVPPSWSPEMREYSLRQWVVDIGLWATNCDLQPHQQCVAIIQYLGGAAREVGRNLSPPEMFNGGVINGVQLDPVSYLITMLQARFAALDEEA